METEKNGRRSWALVLPMYTAILGGAPNATSLLFIKDITFRSTRPSIYVGLRYRLNPKTSLKASFIYGYSKTEDFAGSRNENRGFQFCNSAF